MAAEIGNQYALGNDGGRPTKLTPEMIQTAREYIDWCEANPVISEKTKTVTDPTGAVTETVEREKHPRLPTMAGMARRLGISRDTLHEWTKANKEFSDLKEIAGAAMEDVAWTGGAAGTLTALIAKLNLMAEHNKREKTDMTTDGKELPTPIMTFVPDAVRRNDSNEKGPQAE